MEKPLDLTLRDEDEILATVRKPGGGLRLSYIRRFKRCFARAKQQVLDGHLSKIMGGTPHVCNTRAQAFETLKRIGIKLQGTQRVASQRPRVLAQPAARCRGGMIIVCTPLIGALTMPVTAGKPAVPLNELAATEIVMKIGAKGIAREAIANRDDDRRSFAAARWAWLA